MDDDNSVDESDKSDSDIIKECEIQMNQILDSRLEKFSELEKNEIRLEKRKKCDDDTNSEEGFVEVSRRKKRLLRSFSNNIAGGNLTRSDEITKFEVCITSKKELPKQMALAKLLRNENICNVNRIKYKSPFKVFICFEKDTDATKLIENENFKKLEYNCRKTLESNIVYGIIRGVDLEFSEEEIFGILRSDIKILAVKRLKRLDYSGKWVESESVRICFEGKSLPIYVTAFDCNFNVENYIFPVTQCSGCWKFGHMIKVCPIKKILCPKCGSTEHNNCDLKTFKCLNCKGLHLVLDRSCPIYRKEKEIRLVMSKDNVPYKIALELVMDNSQKENSLRPTQPLEITSNLTEATYQPTYSQVVARAHIHREENMGNKLDRNIENSQKKAKTKKSRKYKINENQVESLGENTMEEEEHSSSDIEEHKKRRFDLKKLLANVFNIWRSMNSSIEKKISAVIVAIFEEVKVFVSDFFSGRKILETILELFNISNG
ncbi:uncharacterized protein LOC132903634 [Amyelois transitella]|uniref:uncharacterized protein LOC132903634 n=1 Tax=Amyelois transitella TaxID=680683 RepID=UPI00299018F3|nr:uncharacterized protein LOC132903634 [Amyelois transitella]